MVLVLTTTLTFNSTAVRRADGAAASTTAIWPGPGPIRVGIVIFFVVVVIGCVVVLIRMKPDHHPRPHHKVNLNTYAFKAPPAPPATTTPDARAQSSASTTIAGS